jgi:hypothetical protein
MKVRQTIIGLWGPLVLLAGCWAIQGLIYAVAPQQTAEQGRRRQDIAFFEQNNGDAEKACAPLIEREAKHDWLWTYGVFFSRPFDRQQWADEDKKLVLYSGDNIRFRTSIGTWERMSYRCWYDPQTKTARGVSVTAGRLPSLFAQNE